MQKTNFDEIRDCLQIASLVLDANDHHEGLRNKAQEKLAEAAIRLKKIEATTKGES